MNTQHTKGNWVIRDGDSQTHFEILGEYKSPKTIAILPTMCFVDKEEAKANAKLIAASPRLLEALEGLLTFFGTYEDDYGGEVIPEFEQARQAIQQATN